MLTPQDITEAYEYGVKLAYADIEKEAANRMMREMDASNPELAQKMRSSRAAVNMGNKMVKDPSLTMDKLHPQHAETVRQGAKLQQSRKGVGRMQDEALNWMNAQRGSGSKNIAKSNITDALASQTKLVNKLNTPSLGSRMWGAIARNPVKSIGGGLLAAGAIGGGLALANRKPPEVQNAVQI